MANENNLPDQTSVPHQPGEVISPGAAQASTQPAVETPPQPVEAPAQSEQSAPAAPPVAAVPPPQPVPEVTQAEPEPAVLADPEPETPVDDSPTFDDEAAAPSKPIVGAVEWTASEFIAHEKSTTWYIQLAIAAALLAVALFLLTGDVITGAVVLVGAAFLGFYGARQPRQLQYRLDGQGITIGQKHFGYSEFRSFSVIPEGAFSSIMLMPLKRFAPTLSIYYAPEQEEEIAALLSQQLPYHERQADAVDRLMRRIRF